ncbi:MAG: hypothetical protein WCK09_13340 [Bacteroidota bacterium]
MKIMTLTLLFNMLTPVLLFSQNTDWFQKGFYAEDPKKQIEFFTKSIEQGTDLFASYFCRASSKLSQKDVQGAIDDYSKCIELDSNDAGAYVSRGRAKQSIGVNYQEAVADILKAHEIAKRDSIAILLFDWLDLNKADCQGMIVFYNKVLKLFPVDLSVYNKLGYCYLASGEYSFALENFNNCIALQPKKIDAILGLTLVCYYQNDLVNAKKHLDQAKKVKPVLKKGVAGFEAFKKEGYSFTEKDNETLKVMFSEWK